MCSNGAFMGLMSTLIISAHSYNQLVFMSISMISNMHIIFNINMSLDVTTFYCKKIKRRTKINKDNRPPYIVLVVNWRGAF